MWTFVIVLYFMLYYILIIISQTEKLHDVKVVDVILSKRYEIYI